MLPTPIRPGCRGEEAGGVLIRYHRVLYGPILPQNKTKEKN